MITFAKNHSRRALALSGVLVAATALSGCTIMKPAGIPDGAEPARYIEREKSGNRDNTPGNREGQGPGEGEGQT
ncbi:hypothetical protein [Pseudogemmobacter faecipullorum]|uniref:Argininosuccinate lyase n=1 Tax=Pseudogemmobacter faecipullorum TaxID=2755041 RepID=A0ABS8CKQ8_9RHOB|nr:hypothetical protein [Pseudogemmobacter faecipullorum]MCB5409981.1 hypothetical protein [Pseudogemmobacter faecipullorum]